MKVEMMYFRGKIFDKEYKITESHTYLYSIDDEEDEEYIKNRIIGKLRSNYFVQLKCVDESI